MAKKKVCPNAKVFHSAALRRLKAIHRASRLYNKLVGKPHAERLMELMRHHTDEIEDLIRRKDKHFLVETGDLAVLCLELLLEYHVSPDDLMNKCFGRYERKLNSLLAQVASARKSGSKRQTYKRRR